MNHKNQKLKLTSKNMEKIEKMLRTYNGGEIEIAYYFVVAEAIRRQYITLEQAHNGLDTNIREIQKKQKTDKR